MEAGKVLCSQKPAQPSLQESCFWACHGTFMTSTDWFCLLFDLW